MDSKAQNPTHWGARWLLWAAVGAALVGGIVVFWVMRSSANFVVRTIDYTVNELANRSGVSPFLIRGLVILATIHFFWAVAKYTETWWGFRKLKPSLRLYTNKYGIIIVAYVGLFFVAMYLASLEALAYKWCAETPEGIRTFDAPGKDPVWGIELKPCSPDQIALVRQQHVGFQGAQQIHVASPATFEFFDPTSGRPKVWYAKTPEGTYELFDKAGQHPRTGEPLTAINGFVVQELIRLHREDQARQQQQAAQQQAAEREQQQRAFVERYLNTAIVNQVELREAAVVILDDGGGASQVTEEALAQLLNRHGIQVRSLFKQRLRARVVPAHCLTEIWASPASSSWAAAWTGSLSGGWPQPTLRTRLLKACLPPTSDLRSNALMRLPRLLVAARR